MPASKQIEKALFEAALELTDAAVRAAFLDQACIGQAALRDRLEKLLAVHSLSDEFFRAVPLRDVGLGVAEQPAAARNPVEAAETVNAVIGRYRLLQRLGEGGCGVVYLAEQMEPVRRKVALKIIRLGMDTESVIARFEAERQALALMDHPSIARVLDAGATESGRPYFVMEWVQGVKITEFCNQNQLDVNQRLQLFIQICHAIQHAHQKGIIHRDIKPSNILVAIHDGVPMPKVIDFGIAKAVEGRLLDNTMFTACEQFVGTPAYMSPEQADMSGLDVDTRSDIYSLGVLLYEILTGQTPFDSKELVKSGMDEMRKTLREREPQPPSTLLTSLGNTKLALVAAQHHSEPPRLISSVRGDLDWIVMKALEKERTRRYETANGLAMDVQRFLNSEPIVARPPSRIYKFQKLVRRNWVVFAAIAAVTTALLFGLGMSTWLFLQEREARNRAVAAEQQENRLRQESDRLRQEAEFRQKLTEAIVARSRDKITDADQLVAGIPAPTPNLEYAELYRALGDWNALYGRWKKAVDRFAVLVQVNQPDDWDVTTLDYLRLGPALLEAGDMDGYEEFRRSAVAHFSTATNPVPVERVLKISLLTPPNADFLTALAPLAETASNSLAGALPQDVWQRSLAAWRSFSLALMEYRRGNYIGVEEWRQKSVAFESGNVVRDLNFQIVLAMVHYQNRQIEVARSELAAARKRVEAWFNDPAVRGNDYWFDWVFARILLREATALIGDSKG